MLLRLNINNFAVLENVELDFYNHLTIISGESGAGKSMLIDALSYLAGKRASMDDIRYDTSGLVLEGVFDFPNTATLNALLEQYNIPVDEVFIVKREIMHNKKSIVKINNQMITLGQLQEIMQEVFTIHTQHKNDELLETSRQIDYLDRYIELYDEEDFKQYQQLFYQYDSIQKRIAELEYKDRNRLEQLELIEHQYNELQLMNFTTETEEDDLEKELEYLMNFENVNEKFEQIKSILDGEISVQSLLYDVVHQLEGITPFDEKYSIYTEKLEESYHLLTELNSQVTNDLSTLEYDEARLNEIQDRLNSINQLKRKFNETFEGLLRLERKLETDINDLKNFSQSYEELINEKEKVFKQLNVYAKKLHDIRLDRKDFLESAIVKELEDLDMKDVQFKIDVKETQFNTLGFSNVEFFITTNKGEPLKPLNKVASGGEVSRINLGLRSIFSMFENQALVILDEIDSGVSGKVATKMAEKMKLLAKTRQVFAISHLPQAAAVADHHLHVYKTVVNDRTVSKAEYLDENEHIEEIARMLSGSTINDAAIKNAKELIKTSKQ
ncbi:DNA repair protein RecN [Nosocomiicoccus sp. HMSC09A07]|uniref:DNA repair protein RecN n=1 Tax=Nosocomiicoccus sp. HMSC09A07 TaxID=1581145 RepID=UPI0008A51D7A|nr:DNA repair protein RecN [Nosocomiicoccus sp. HMSC09A07]OFS64210.1 DNA repair protein RecN [Nosocomiicoccus sp. HMSC09A07]